MKNLTDASPRLSDQELDTRAVQELSEFGKGLRSGTYGTGSQLAALGGAVADRAGLDGVATSLRGTEAGLRKDAERYAPRVTSLKDVHGLRDFGDLTAGVLGSSAPMAAAQLGAAAMTGGGAIPAMLAGGAVAALPEMGDVVQRQRDAGQPVDLGAAALGGGASGLLQSVVPGMAGAKLLGKAASKSVGRELAGLPVDAALAAAGEGTKQLGAGQQLDPSAMLEQGALEAIGGAPVVGASALKHAVVGSAKAAPAPQAALGAAPEAPGQLRGLFDGARKGLDAALERGAAGLPLGDLKEYATAAPARLQELLQKSDSEYLPKLQQWGGELLTDVGLPPERRAELTQAMSSLGDDASTKLIAGAKRAQELGKRALEDAQSLYDATAEKVKGATDEAKKSEDYAGLRQTITDVVTPILQQHRPEVLDSPAAMQRVANSLRSVLASAMKGGQVSEATHNKLRIFFGDDTETVLRELHANVADATDKDGAEKLYAAINGMADRNTSRQGKMEVVRKNLKRPEKGGTDRTDAEVEAAVEWLDNYSKGRHTEGLGPQQAKDVERRARAMLAEHFKDPDAVLKEWERGAKGEQLSAEDQVEGAKFTPDEMTEGKAAVHTVSKKPIPSPSMHRSQYNDESQAERQIREIEAKRPDVKARWVSAKEHATLTGEDVGDVPAGHGYVIAEKVDAGDKLTPRQLSAMRFDSKKGDRAKNPSVVDAGDGVLLDARKMVKVAEATLPYNETDGKSRVHRVARVFMDAVASAQEHLGRAFNVPDSTVVAVAGNKSITFGELKKISMAPEKGRDFSKELKDLREEYRAAKLDQDPRAMDDVARKAQRVLDARDEQIGGDIERDTTRAEDFLREQGKDEADPEQDNIHLAAATTKAEDLQRKARPLSNQPSAAGRKGATDSAINRLENSGSKIQRTLGEKARTVFAKYDDLDLASQARLNEIVGKSPSDQTPIINELHAKFSSSKSEPGSAPDPKAVAAKKAAFLKKARSGDADLIKALRSSDDAKGLQRAAEALKDGSADKVLDAINERLGELVRGSEDVAYSMQTRAYSLQGTAASAGPVDRAAVEAHVAKVLGPKIKVAWENIFHAGDYDPTTDVMRLSVHSLNPMSVAYHESLHGFFKRLSDRGAHDVANVLHEAASTSHVKEQLHALLANEPDALRQLADSEERVAYMYQFWADGKLTVGPKAKTTLAKVADFFRRVLGIWSNDERALHIMEAFNQGDFAKTPGSAYRATMEQGRNAALEKAKSFTQPALRLADEITAAGGQRLRDTGIPALRELADAMKLHGTDQGDDPGFIPAARTERARVMNALGAELVGMDKQDIAAALDALQTKTEAGSTKALIAQRAVRKVLDDMHAYMTEAGVKVNDLGVGKDYFPRVYNTDYISRHTQDFMTVLEKHGLSSADAKGVVQRLMTADGNEFTVETGKPGMQFLKERVLKDIPDAELARFMRKDMFAIMSSYVTQATRRAEWARRFGDDGAGVDRLMSRAKAEGATKQQLDVAQRYVMGVDGTLGDDINPTARRLMGDMIVYQNLRLLPLAIFSSIVDPVGIMVRGGTVGDAFSTFVRGVKEVAKNFQKAPGKDAETELAETLGVVDNATLVHTLGALYSQGMVGDTARKINDTFFRFNLMEQFNTSMRVGATQAALRFIARHADGKADVHSARWMAELGLEPGDVRIVGDRPALTEADGLSVEQALRMRLAVNRWVDGAVLRPDAADKPIWMNDPHWALVAHLKQFVYSFNETILKRIGHEYAHGNYRPIMAMASYVPIMIAADTLKGLIQGGGELPEWKKNWGAGDYVWSGVQRGGLLGVGQFAVDATGHNGVGGLAGPTIGQLGGAVEVMGGRETFRNFLLHSMPANALYAHAAHAEAPDPTFAD